MQKMQAAHKETMRGTAMVFRKQRNTIRKHVVFAYRKNTGALALVNTDLIRPRKLRGVRVNGIAVDREITFKDSDQIINRFTRRFWLMDMTSTQEEQIGDTNLQWCDEEGSIEAMRIDKREKQLLRKAREVIRTQVPRRIEDCVK